MEQYSTNLEAAEIISWIKEKKEQSGGHLDFYEEANVEYMMRYDFDHHDYDIEAGSDYMLVSFKATLDIEPRVEQNYWILQVHVTGELGPCRRAEEPSFAERELSLADFERQFLSKTDAKVSVKVWAQTAEAKAHFDEWVSKMKARH
jgi:hypothetical protein